MSQGLAAEHFVHVSPSITNVLQIFVSFQLNDNALNCTFRDSNFQCNVSNAFRRIFGQTQQDVRMIRQKSPRRIIYFS
jgi:hypothetical protein